MTRRQGRARRPWILRVLHSLLRLATAGLLLAALVVAGIVGWSETQCVAPTAAAPAPAAAAASGRSSAPVIDEAPWQRVRVASHASYPEWYIVHAYEDFAAVLGRSDAHEFDYLASIAGYWTTLCGIRRFTAPIGEIPNEWKATLYVIGISYSLEMLAKGAYEETFGRLAAATRGGAKTPEDRVALEVARDYAAFLQQTPWYEYPFLQAVRRLWSGLPPGEGAWLRRAERRIALSIEYTAKAAYAVGIRALAGVVPADTRIRSVVRGLQAADRAADPRIQVVRTLDDGRVLIETPRYRAFTEVVLGLLSRGRTVEEIAGQQWMLLTAQLPEGRFADSGVAVHVFSYPIQSRPGWRRIGLDVHIPSLATVRVAIADAGGTIEHLHDY
jgi:hypothetical protein